MAGMGHERRFCDIGGTSAIPPIAALKRTFLNRRSGPGAVIPISSVPNRRHSYRRFRLSNFAQTPPDARAYADYH
jgi:hypothetical protein